MIFIYALVELTRYCDETYNSVSIAVFNIVLSTMMLSFTAIFLMCCSRFRGDDNNDDDNFMKCQTYTKSWDYVINILSFTLLGYFFPYMVISFIQDPLHSFFIYIVISLWLWLLVHFR